MKIKKLNESTIDDLNSLPTERGMSKVSFELVKKYQNILRQFPIGKILKHNIDAGEETFTKVEDGEFGWWEHFRAPWKDTKRVSEFDLAHWLAGREVISRSDIIEENLDIMKIKKLTEDIQHCWFGYYLDIKGNRKYFYMAKDTTSNDPDEASEIMEDSIPEPFTKFVFQGSVANTQAEKQGWKLVESKELVNEAKTVSDFPEYTEAGDCLKALLLGADLELENPRILDHYIGKDFADFTLDINGDINSYRIHKGGNVTIKESLSESINTKKYVKDFIKDFNISKENVRIKKGPYETYSYNIPDKCFGLYITLDDNTIDLQHTGLDSVKEKYHIDSYKTITTRYSGGRTSEQKLLVNIKEADDKSLSESIKVDTIADYITDHYDFDDIDDKYSITWDDGTKSKEIKGYLKVIERPNIKEKLTLDESLFEASYGGAYDIADDQFFTREDIESAAEEVMNHIDETFTEKYVLNGTWLENGRWTVNVGSEDGQWEFEELIHVDMRKIKEPWHLKRAYASEMAAKLINKIKYETQPITEELDEAIVFGHNIIKIGDTLTSKSGHKIHIDDMSATLSPFENNAIVTFYYSYEMTDGTKGSSTCTTHDLKNMLNESLNESEITDAKPIETGAEVGMAAVISDLIKDEYEAIDGYNSAIATAQAEGFLDMVNVLSEIQAEENLHIGQLQTLMNSVDPNAHLVDDGQQEGIEQLANPIAAEVVEESINANDLSDNAEKAFQDNELEAFVCDALKDGSATEKDLMLIAIRSSIIEEDDMKRAIAKCKEN